MASVEDYKDFGKSLSDYITASDASELTSAFKEGGALHNALKSLKAQEEELNKYQDSLLESFNPGQEGSLTQEQVNQQIEKNDAVRNEITHLQARLNDLSESVGQSKSSWNISRAKSEFVKGVEQGLKVESGFFETLANTIRSVFSFTNKQKIEETKISLESITVDIQSKNDDRLSVPGKGKQQELEQNVGIESPTLSVESGKVNTPMVEESKSNIPEPPPLPSEGLGKKKNDIPEPPPLPSEELGKKKNDIPEPPPLPSEELGKKKNDIPEPPPLPSEGLGKKKNDIPKNTTAKEDLLEQIRNRKKKVSLSKDHLDNSGERDFVYVKSEEVKSSKESGSDIMNAMRERMGVESPDVSPEVVLNGKDKKAQMNMLYSAMVDGNDKLVEAFKTHETEVDSGRVDDWEEPIMESKPTFSKEDIESIEKAALETKQRIDRGEDLPNKSSKKTEVEVSKPEENLTQDSQKVVEESGKVNTTKVEEVNNIPEPPPLPPEGFGKKKSGVPEAPPLPTEKNTKSTKPKAKNEEISQSKPDTSDLLEEIRARAGGGLKSVESDKSVNFDIDGFTYTKPKVEKERSSQMNQILGRRQAIAGDLESQLEEMSEKEQLNMLYSAVIDDDQKKISAIYQACDDEVFTPEAVKKVCEAAKGCGDTV